MGAKNSTMLAKMGFSDPDRNDPMHDAACGYVASKATELCQRLLRLRENTFIDSVCPVLEVPICKGLGHYKATVGFADVVIEARVKHERHVLYEPDVLGVEVKWTESSVSDAIRQIGLYQEYCECTLVGGALSSRWLWALATHYSINAEQKQALQSRNIVHVKLNRAAVEEFAQRQRGQETTPDVEL